jgi:transposase
VWTRIGDEHVLAIVAVPVGAVVARRAVAASAGGYVQALRFARRYAPSVRLWGVEGAGHYGAVLARYLAERGSHQVEIEEVG